MAKRKRRELESVTGAQLEKLRKLCVDVSRYLEQNMQVTNHKLGVKGVRCFKGALGGKRFVMKETQKSVAAMVFI